MTGRPRSLELKNSVHIRVPDWLLEAIDRIARDNEVPRSTVVLDAVKRQLRTETPNIFRKEPAIGEKSDNSRGDHLHPGEIENMIDHRIVAVDRSSRKPEADRVRIDTVAKAMADSWNSEPDRAYWRRKAKTAIQVVRDLT